MAKIASNEFGCNSAAEILAVCNSPLTALLSGGGGICTGESAYLTIFFTGEAPFTFVLAENGLPRPPVTTAENPHTFSVSPAVGAVFSLQNVSNAQGSGLASGSASVAVFPLPLAMIAAPDTICLGDTLVLTASGGLSFEWSSGQTTAQIETQPTATTTYAVTVSDANACTAAATLTVAVKDCTSGVFSADGGAKNIGFKVSPNPLPDGEPLQILLENDFTGPVKIEILSLDGRVLQNIFREKTAWRVVFGLPGMPAGASFFVRISDGKTSAARLVLKF